MTAQHYGLDNLTVIVDRNRIQQGDFTENTIRMEPLAARFAAFGFAVEEIDGHSTAALLDALLAPAAGARQTLLPDCANDQGQRRFVRGESAGLASWRAYRGAVCQGGSGTWRGGGVVSGATLQRRPRRSFSTAATLI